MKKAVFAVVPLLLLAALALGACGKGGGGQPGTSPAASNVASMDATNFTVKEITIKAGESVIFDDTNGGYHVICLGKDMVCDSKAKGPQDLQGNGFVINQGEKKSLTFSDPGTYDITCSVHANMNLVVKVE